MEYPELRYFDPEGVLEEFESAIRSEMDFENEADNMKVFSQNFAGDPTVRFQRSLRRFRESASSAWSFAGQEHS